MIPGSIGWRRPKRRAGFGPQRPASLRASRSWPCASRRCLPGVIWRLWGRSVKAALQVKLPNWNDYASYNPTLVLGAGTIPGVILRPLASEQVTHLDVVKAFLAEWLPPNRELAVCDVRRPSLSLSLISSSCRCFVWGSHRVGVLFGVVGRWWRSVGGGLTEFTARWTGLLP